MSENLQIAIYTIIGTIAAALITGIATILAEVVKKPPSAPKDDKKIEKKSLFTRIKQRLQPQTILIIALVSIIVGLIVALVITSNRKNSVPQSPIVVTTPTVLETPTVTAMPTSATTPTATATPTTTPTPPVPPLTVLKTFDFEGSAGSRDSALWDDASKNLLSWGGSGQYHRSGQNSLVMDGNFGPQNENGGYGVRLTWKKLPAIQQTAIPYAEAWVYLPEHTVSTDNNITARIDCLYYIDGGSYMYVRSADTIIQPGIWTLVKWSGPKRFDYYANNGKLLSAFDNKKAAPDTFQVIVWSDKEFRGSVYLDDITFYQDFIQ